MTEDNKSLTIFEVKNDEFQKAFDSFISGRTPNTEIKQREGRGGTTLNYVSTYYMTEQINLLTGFRWTSECLQEKFIPNEDKPREIGAKMRVTIWDKDNRQYQHTSWGQKDVVYFATKKDKQGNIINSDKAGLPISVFDDLKAAYSDGIKKCLSYFGIARDVYGGKEMEFFSDDNPVEDGSNNDMNQFDKYITKKGLTYDDVFRILNIESISEIKDYREAYNTVKGVVEKK